MKKLIVTSTVFKNGDFIPIEYTCDANNISPQLHWEGAPAETQGYAVIVDDTDASGGVWTHWVLYQIRAAITTIETNEDIINMTVGTNSWGRKKYDGPCPPEKDAQPHHYHFRVFALSDFLNNVPSGMPAQELRKAMEGKILAEGEIVGLYKRKESVFQ